MKLCSRDHEEICFDGGDCPVCDLLGIIRGQQEEIVELKSELAATKEQE